MALRKIRKNARLDAPPPSKRGVKAMECKGCENIVENVSGDASSVECGRCVQKQVAPPEETKKPKLDENGEKRKRGRPRKNGSTAVVAVKPTKGWGKGWHLKMRFVAPDGNVYSKGKLVDAKSKLVSV